VRDRCTSTRRDPLPSVCCSREQAAWSQPADPCYRKPRGKEASPMALASLPPGTIRRSPHRCRPAPATHAQQQALRPDVPAAAIAFIDPALTYARSRWRPRDRIAAGAASARLSSSSHCGRPSRSRGDCCLGRLCARPLRPGRGRLAAGAGDGDRGCSRSRPSPPPTYTSQEALMRP
jgi:hypothetical protein